MRENSPTTPEKVAAYDESAPNLFVLRQELKDLAKGNPTAR